MANKARSTQLRKIEVSISGASPISYTKIG